MKKNTKGYIVERDYGGDADNFERWMILTPNGRIVEREIYTYQLDHVLESLPDLTKKPKKKLVIIMDEKDGDTDHICNEDACPFYSKTKDGDMGILCKKLWATPPKGKSSLSSLCNYYDVQNLVIAEVDDDESIKDILEKQSA